MTKQSLICCLLAAGFLSSESSGEAVPKNTSFLLSDYCTDCHNADKMKGDINLDHASIDWNDPNQRDLWERVTYAIDQELMPPPDKPQPSTNERQALIDWIDPLLLKHVPIGGTRPRRLNLEEYQTSIRKLFALPGFKTPLGFPKDNEVDGFTNISEGLVLSPPLLEAYAKVAWQVADELYPPAKAASKSTLRTAGPEDMVISFSASSLQDGALRLASRCPTVMRSCTWPSRIEITTSGTYRISIDASKFRPKSEDPMILEVRARELTANDRSNVEAFRVIKEIPVSSESPRTVTFEADLYEGQTLLFRWLNAEMDHDHEPLSAQMAAWFEKDQRFLAAWQKAVFPEGLGKGPRSTYLRGKNGWNIVKKHWEDPKLDLSEATMDSKTTTKLLEVFNSNQGTFNLADALCHYYFEKGPSLEIHSVSVEGPLKIVAGPKDKHRDALQRRVAGLHKAELSNEAFARKMLQNFLPRAFRRPVDEATIKRFLKIATTHWQAGHSFDEGMHLLIRNILVSPRFLYRSLDDGPMDDHDLATRLSYFLTQGPPDAKLRDLARRGRLSEPWVLRREALRLLPTDPKSRFVQSFTRQWLGTGLLPEIMPDPKFGFTPYYVEIARDELEYSFAEMIRKDRPMSDFIDPDFTYTSPLFARNIYKLKLEHAPSKERPTIAERRFGRFEIERGGRFGGLLGQSAVMMATANGVDTQPVLRGVWVLENILGNRPPPPPKDVPALTPDTRGTTSPRELLAAHTTDASCASCHKHIDPIGFMLQNYDPVGKWRARWPEGGAKIDPSGVLPDGTKISDSTDFKRWLLANIDQFSACLAEKLMTYATGRVPNYAERHEIEGIVQRNHDKGFRELILELIASETFRSN